MPNNDLMDGTRPKSDGTRGIVPICTSLAPGNWAANQQKKLRGVPQTLGGSRSNLQIDEELGKAKKHPAHLTDHYEEAKENWRLYGKWHRKYGSIETATEADSVIEFPTETLKQTDPPFPLPKLHYDPLWKLERNIQQDEDLLAFQVKWMDRYNTIRKDERTEDTVPFDNTIRSYIGNFSWS